MELLVPTSLGPSRLTIAEASDPLAALWLGHGAGGGIDARDLDALARDLPAHGITVLRFEQPWRVAGKKIAPRPAALDTAWLEAAPNVAHVVAGLPLAIGGRSAGARVACRTATEVGAGAVVCLAFPLHPPGKPEKSRIDELLLPEVPRLVLQGDRDAFGTAADMTAALEQQSGVTVVSVPGADHGMKVLASAQASAAGVDALVVKSVARFVLGEHP